MYKFSLFLILSLFSVVGCRDQSAEELYKQGLEFSTAGNYQAAVTLYKDALAKDPNFISARYELSVSYIETGKLDKAENELEKVQRQDPQNREALLLLSHIYNSSGRPEKTIDHLTSLEDSQLLDSSAYVLLGTGYSLKKDYTAAERSFRDALQQDKLNISAKLGLARILYVTNRYAEGHDLLDEVIEQAPGNTAPYYIYFQQALKDSDPDRALEALQQITKRDPNDIGALYTQGMLLLDFGRLEEGKALATIIKSKFPKHPAGSRVQGVYYYAKGQYKQAIGELLESNQSIPDVPGFYFLGLSYYQQGQLEQALSSFQKALDIQPAHNQARLMVAQTLLKQGRTEDARIQVSKVLATEERNGLALSILGGVYLAQGKFDLAMANLDKAIELNPDLAGAHFKKGLFSLLKGDLLNAEADLAKAVSAAPEVLNARLLLTSFYIKQQNYPKAIETLKNGLNGLPDDALLYNYLAAALFAQGKDEKALEALNSAKEVKPDYFTPYFNRANYFLTKEDPQKALAEYQQVLNISPNDLVATLKTAVVHELSGDNQQAKAFFERAGSTSDPRGHLAYRGYLLRIGEQAKAQEVLDAAYMTYPTDPSLLQVLGQHLLSQKNYDQATKIFLELVAVDAGLGWPRLIGVHLARGDVPAAKEVADQAIALKPDREFGYLLLASIYDHNKEFQRGREVLAEGISRCKNNLKLKMKVADLYLRQGEQAKGLAAYEKLSEEAPGFAAPIFAAATIYDAIGDKKKALAAYKKTLELDEGHALALNNLAYLYADVYENYDEALQLATKAFRNKPDNPFIQDTLGFILLQKGQAEQAVALLEKSSRLLPNAFQVKIHLSRAYLETGRKDAAIASLDAIVASGDASAAKEARLLLEKM